MFLGLHFGIFVAGIIYYESGNMRKEGDLISLTPNSVFAGRSEPNHT
jgi:hypothetical protein